MLGMGNIPRFPLPGTYIMQFSLHKCRKLRTWFPRVKWHDMSLVKPLPQIVLLQAHCPEIDRANESTSANQGVTHGELAEDAAGCCILIAHLSARTMDSSRGMWLGTWKAGRTYTTLGKDTIREGGK